MSDDDDEFRRLVGGDTFKDDFDDDFSDWMDGESLSPDSNIRRNVNSDHKKEGNSRNPRVTTDNVSLSKNSVESDGSFLNGGKCDLRTGQCTGGGGGLQRVRSFNTFLSFLSGRSSTSKSRPDPQRRNQRNTNVNDPDADDRLLVRVAYWLGDNKLTLLIGGGIAFALYAANNNLFRRQHVSSCGKICESCKMRDAINCKCLPKMQRGICR